MNERFRPPSNRKCSGESCTDARASCVDHAPIRVSPGPRCSIIVQNGQRSLAVHFHFFENVPTWDGTFAHLFLHTITPGLSFPPGMDGGAAMLEFCLLTLALLVLICGALVEQMEEQQRCELTTSSTDYATELQ